MKYVSKRQRKRQNGVQFSSESDTNSSESEIQKKVARKPKVRQTPKNTAVAATNYYKIPIIAPAENRRNSHSSSTSSSGSGGSGGSGSSGSTMNRYTSSSLSSSHSGSVERRPSIYHYQNAQTLTLASFIKPGLFKSNSSGKASKSSVKSSGKPSNSKASSSSVCVGSPSKTPSIDPEENSSDDLLISSPQEPKRTSVLTLDLGPLMMDLDDWDLPYPSWRNPLNLSILAPPTEPEQTDEKRPLNPIGYEIMMLRKLEAMLKQQINDEVAKLVAKMETMRFLWKGIVSGQNIWEYKPEELVKPESEENKSVELRSQRNNIPNNRAKNQPKLARSNYYGYPLVCVPGYWIYPMQQGYWYSYWPQQHNWWDNMGFVNSLAKMDMFLVNLSPMEIHAAQMYAIHGEAFFETPQGKCYKEESRTPAALVQYYPPPNGHHQVNGGRANKSQPKRNQAEQQPMRKSGSGNNGSRPGGSGSGSGSASVSGNGQKEVGSARKASRGAQGSSKNSISEDHKSGVNKQRNRKSGWWIVESDSDD
ncbi:uncharacterized protein [Drosophila takahashii]|uniref:uncharacterized protein isoform X1 n=1 Tax=Drosophila takahashii TaxID=29030 RepID=UPI003899252C